jgi:hypothetical protein
MSRPAGQDSPGYRAAPRRARLFRRIAKHAARDPRPGKPAGGTRRRLAAPATRSDPNRRPMRCRRSARLVS